MTAQNIILPEVLDISAGEPLKANLCSVFSKRNAVSVDASKVSKISTPCVQLLIAAGMEAERQGLSFKIDTPTSVFSESFQNLGLSEYLDKWGNK